MLHSKGWFWVIAIACVSGLAGILFGYCTAVIAGALIALNTTFILTPFEEEMIAASILVGALFGGLCAGLLTNRCGRRFTIFIASLACFFFIIGTVYSHSIVELSLMRFGLGVGIGIFSMAVPLYVAETSPDRFRGALVCTFQLAIALGIVFSYVAGLAFQEDSQWQWMFGIACVPAFLLAVGIFFLPESPRWLIARNQPKRARRALTYFYSLADAKKHVLAIMPTHENQMRWVHLFKKPYLGVLMVSMGVFILQNISGIDGILYYAPYLFKAAGIQTQQGAMIATLLLGVINVIATFIALIVVDSLGRRYLLLWGCAMMSLSLLFLSAILYLFPPGFVSSWVTLGCLCVFIFMFAISLGPIPYVLMAELFPAPVRDVGMSFSIVANWLANIAVTFTYLSLLSVIKGSGLFLLYGLICAVGFYFIFLYVPETKQLSLEEIESKLRAAK